MKCQYCHRSYENFSSWNNHLRTVKKCLLEREKQGVIIEKRQYFVCPTCNKNYTSKCNLQKHSCKKKLMHEVDDLKKKLLDALLEIKKRDEKHLRLTAV